MGDHFLPSIFPAIAVGALYGASLGGMLRILLGAAGAMVTSTLAFVLFEPVFSADGLPVTLALIGVALVGAFLFTRAGWVLRRSPHSRR